MRCWTLWFTLLAAVPALGAPVPELYQQSYAAEARGQPTEALAALEAMPPVEHSAYVWRLRRAWKRIPETGV